MAVSEPVCGSNFIDEAQIFSRLKDEGNTAAWIADQYEVSRSYVAHSMRLLNLPAKIKSAVKKGSVSKSAALAYLEFKKPDLMLKVFNAEGSELSTRDIKRKALNHSFKANSMAMEEDQIRSVLGSVVKIKGNEESGQIIIKYKNKKTFEHIMGVIESASSHNSRRSVNIEEVFGDDFTI